MLHAGETLCRIVVFVVDVQIVAFYGVGCLWGEEVVVDKRFCCLAGKFHHHTGWRVGVHVGVLACDVVRLRLDDFKENVACLGAACDAALVAVGDVAFCHFLARTLHQFKLNVVLNFLYAHLLFAVHADAVGDFLDKRFVLALLRRNHRFADCRLDFLFVVAHDSSVAFNHCLYHILGLIISVLDCGFKGRYCFSNNKANFYFWKLFGDC